MKRTPSTLCIMLLVIGFCGGIVQADSVAFIYADSAAADSYEGFLEGLGYNVQRIHVDEVAQSNLTPFGLIMIGPNIGSGYQWGPDEAVSLIQNSDKPVLGLGRGGARLFGEMGLDINWGNAAVGYYDSMYVPNPNHPFFKSPIPIPLNEGVVRLFYSEHACVGEYGPYMPSDVLQLGQFFNGSSHRSLVKQSKHVLLGFVAKPDDMREVGLALLANIVYNTYEEPGVMYGVNASSNGLSRINWATGDSEFIGPLDPDPGIYLTPIAMAIRSSDNTIFVWNNSDQGQATGILLTVNPQTGRATPVNALTPPQGQISALAFGPRGLLYGLDYSLYSISTATGVREHISSLEGHRVAAAECFDGKTIYALTFAKKLLTIDPFSGAVGRELDLDTDIGLPGSLCYDATSSQLIGSGLGSPEGDILFDLNPHTGEVSNIRKVKNGTAPQGMGIAVPPPPPLHISLNVEDALEGIPVNKVVGDVGSGPTNYTRAEVTTKLVSFSSSARHNIPVILDTHGTALGTPFHVWLREGAAGDLTEISYDNLGGGRYRVNVDLNAVTVYPGFTLYYYRQIVWHFVIPSSTTPQNVSLTAQIDRPCVDPYANGLIRILSPGSVRSLMVTNRQLLYDNYSTGQVTSLLQRLFTEAQGFPSSTSPTSVIYYVERYNSLARNWDNTTVDYTSEATANVVPNAVDDLIEDWVDDATKYNTITLPVIGSFTYPVSMPGYLLIVGDDHIIPFYRNYDTYTAGKSEDNWTVNSATNPWITVTDENYFFTDNPYGDLYGGEDWEEGDVELWTGRLLGDSAADMLQLLAEGVNRNNGQRGGIVMASVDGWELGLEPDDGRSGEIADLTDVTAILRSKGFVVRNDDVPSSEVRTIDVMSPWEGGSASWNTQFHNAANHNGGMDLFFIGGHDGYDHAAIPGDDFSPDDTPGDYTRFDDDHPIAMIVGCHGGLPVPDIHVPGGVSNSMVYDVIHEGARGYIGATGYSYGSPSNLHRNLWGERLMQHFFINLVEPPGVNSMTVGKALCDAKNDFVFGYGTNDDLDRKTVTEYSLYGVPWSFLWYPNQMVDQMQSASNETTGGADVTLSAIQRNGDLPTYTQSFTVKVGKYYVEEEIVKPILYELVKVQGGGLAVAPDLPILPYVEGHRLTLPYGANVTGLKVLDMSSADIGRYNIPIAAVEPWSEGGLAYTQQTKMDYFYPGDKQLVQYQQVGNEVLLTLFPVQHNPTSDETVYHSTFIVQVTYESPLPVAVTDMTTDSETYLPGEDIRASAMVHNITDEQVQLDWTLVLKDTFGQVQSRTIGKPFYLPSGEVTQMNMSLDGALAAGSYTVELSLAEEKQVVGGASKGVTIADGQILNVSAQQVMPVGEYGAIQVTFANHSAEKVSAQLFLTVQDSGGGIVDDLPYQQVGIAGQSSKTVKFLWMPTQAGSGQFSAIATVVANEHVYGPTTDTFAVQDCPPADLSGDCDVDFEDFAILGSQWLEKTCMEPDWCKGADMDKSQSVDFMDLLTLTDEWLDGVTP